MRSSWIYECSLARYQSRLCILSKKIWKLDSTIIQQITSFSDKSPSSSESAISGPWASGHLSSSAWKSYNNTGFSSKLSNMSSSFSVHSRVVSMNFFHFASRDAIAPGISSSQKHSRAIKCISSFFTASLNSRSFLARAGSSLCRDDVELPKVHIAWNFAYTRKN